MNKLKIIILAVVGIVSFGGAFGLTLVLKKSPAPAAGADTPVQKPSASTRDVEMSEPRQDITLTSDPFDMQRGMSEQKLKTLIDDSMESAREFKSREKELLERENRIKIAQVAIQEDIDRLVNLQTQLSLTLGDIKKEKQLLEGLRIDVSAEEKVNFQKIAATYDTMDVTKSSQVIITMAKGSQLNDAVKILYYMSERNSGKLIGEIATTQPDLAGLLTLELKKVKESE